MQHRALAELGLELASREALSVSDAARNKAEYTASGCASAAARNCAGSVKVTMK
jgi:hypothetical protein